MARGPLILYDYGKVDVLGAQVKKALIFISALSLMGSMGLPSQAVELSCAEGGACVIGDRGPGGGIVFFVSPKAKKWGQYIEAAPDGWDRGRPDPNVEPFCYQRAEDSYRLKATSTAIGTGRTNTTRLIKVCKQGAAATARSYRGGGFTTWSLPSKDEFNELYFEAVGRGITLNTGTPWYWSSSINGGVSSFYAPFQDWDSTFAGSNDAHVRPVRHFKANK